MSDILTESIKAGSEYHVELALAKFKKDINKPTRSDKYPIHLAVLSNNVSIIDKVLKAGADVNIQLGDTGWSALHVALNLGYLVVASRLMAAGASLDLADYKGRTPVDVVSSMLKPYIRGAGPTHGIMYAWGSGSNYQLGTGSTNFTAAPVRLDSLTEVSLCSVVAAKFHSAALGDNGQVYTWGWGRGGRLGHPDCQGAESGMAVITPCRVAGLAPRRVLALAAAKHHMMAATDSGELFTWGGNKDYQLGYAGVEVQVVPAKVASLKQRVVAVAAANKHSLALVAGGEVWSWGCNAHGQLGYATKNNAPSCNPRAVAALKHKVITAISAAKRHSVALTEKGGVFVWGHGVPQPRRVPLLCAPDSLAPGSGPAEEGFQYQSDVVRARAVAIAAGATHTTALTISGAVMTWLSTDPQHRAVEVKGLLAEKVAVSLSAGKYCTAVVTDEGQLYMWEAASGSNAVGSERGGGASSDTRDMPEQGGTPGSASRKQGSAPGCSISSASVACNTITVQRVHGVRHVVGVAVGEKHSVVLTNWSRPPVPSMTRDSSDEVAAAAAVSEEQDIGHNRLLEAENSEEGFELCKQRQSQMDPLSPDNILGSYTDGHSRPNSLDMFQTREHDCATAGVDSLHVICQHAVASSLVEPRSALPLLEHAESYSADILRAYCVSVALRNLDIVLMEAKMLFESLPTQLLQEMEHIFRPVCSIPGLHATMPAPSSGAISGCSTPAGTSLPASSPLSQLLLHSGSGTDLAGYMAAHMLGGSQGATNLAAAAGSFPACPPEPCETAPPPGLAGTTSSAGLEGASQRLLYTLRRRLTRITELEERSARGGGGLLDAQQLAKLGSRVVVQRALAALEAGAAVEDVQAMLDEAATLARQLAEQSSCSMAPAASAPDPISTQVVSSSEAQVAGSGSADAMTSDTVDNCAGVSTPVQVRSTFGFTMQTGSPLGSSLTPEVANDLQSRSANGSSLGSKDKKFAGREVRKGALSQFLSGELEKPAAPKPAQVSVTPTASRAPAWGGVRPSDTAASAGSLREVLAAVQQPVVTCAVANHFLSTTMSQVTPTRASTTLEYVRESIAIDAAEPKNAAVLPAARTVRSRVGPGAAPDASPGLRLSLADLLVSRAPPPVSTAKHVRGAKEAGSSAGPAWGGGAASGSSPPNSHSLRHIQEEQERERSAWATPVAASTSLRPARTAQHTHPGAVGAANELPHHAPTLVHSIVVLGTSPPSSHTHSGATVLPGTSPPTSKWFVPDRIRPLPLSAIQVEQEALKEVPTALTPGPELEENVTSAKRSGVLHNSSRRASKGTALERKSQQKAGEGHTGKPGLAPRRRQGGRRDSCEAERQRRHEREGEGSISTGQGRNPGQRQRGRRHRGAKAFSAQRQEAEQSTNVAELPEGRHCSPRPVCHFHLQEGPQLFPSTSERCVVAEQSAALLHVTEQSVTLAVQHAEHANIQIGKHSVECHL